MRELVGENQVELFETAHKVLSGQIQQAQIDVFIDGDYFRSQIAPIQDSPLENGKITGLIAFNTRGMPSYVSIRLR